MEKNIYFLSKDISKSFFTDSGPKKAKFLYKTMPLENALKTIKNGLWFAKPSIWPDPFERRFYAAKCFVNGNVELENPLIDRFLCCCMTSKKTSEAHWKTYSQEQIGIQFQINRSKLYLFLCCLPQNYHIFIGKVQYQNRDEIENPITKNSFLGKNFNYNNNEDLAKLLLLKRKAFDYEKEIRIIIKNDKKKKYLLNGIALNPKEINFLDIVDTIRIAPTCPNETSDYLIKNLKKITKNQIKIFQSHLYDNTEENRSIMISE